jgi:hypothetical protein
MSSANLHGWLDTVALLWNTQNADTKEKNLKHYIQVLYWTHLSYEPAKLEDNRQEHTYKANVWKTYYDGSNSEAREANCCHTTNLAKNIPTCNYKIIPIFLYGKYVLPNRKKRLTIFSHVTKLRTEQSPGHLDKPPEACFCDLLTRLGTVWAWETACNSHKNRQLIST